jgi:putative MATE family efflux protein
VKRSHEIDFSQGRLLPKLISFSLPVMLSGVLQLAFNAADLIVVGRLCGETALAAVGSNSSLVELLINLLMGLGTGASVLAARYFGAKDDRRMGETVETAALTGAVGGILFALLGIVISEPMLRLMQTPGEVLSLAAVYLRIYFLGIPFLAVYNFLSAVLRSVGDTERPLLYMTVAGVVNVVLNLLLVAVFRLGVVGVAAATVASEVLSCWLTVRCLLRNTGSCRLPRGRLHFSRPQFLQMLRIGLPAGIQGILFSIANVIVQASFNTFGAAVIAGNAAAGSLEGFPNRAQDSVGQGALAAAGQCMGARQYDRVKTVTRTCCLLAAAVSLVVYGVMILLRYPLLGIYTGDPGAQEAAVSRFFVLGSTYFTFGLMCAMTCVVRGLGFAILPTAISLVGICGFRLAWIFTVFARYHELYILYLCYPISWTLTAVGLYAACRCLWGRAVRENESRYRREHPTG